MKKIILLIILGALAWHGSARYRHSANDPAPAEATKPEKLTIDDLRTNSGGQFACDGRTRCSQMKSCDEAKYLLKNCPGVKMDGDGNGIPCERQWCS